MMAGIAGNARLQGYAITDSKTRFTPAFHHNAGGFVAKDNGGFDHIPPYAAMLPIVDLGRW